MDKLKVAKFIEEEVKRSSDNIPKHIVFVQDPYRLTEDLDADYLRLFSRDYKIVEYRSDFYLRDIIEKYKDDNTRNFCILSEKRNNSPIKDYTGWRSNNILLTPQKYLEQRTEIQWGEGINIIGKKLTQYEKELIEWRKKIGKPRILPIEAKAIVVSALTNTNFIEDLLPVDVYLFLYPENQYKVLVKSIPDIEDYLKESLGRSIPFIKSILDNEELYRFFPDFLWLSFIINKLGKETQDSMRGISSELYDRFEKLNLPQKFLRELLEGLQQIAPTICRRQISVMEKRLLKENTAAQRQFIKLIQPKPRDSLTYYSQIAERGRYSKICLNEIMIGLPNYIVSDPKVVAEERLSQIQKDLLQNWFIKSYRNQLRLLNELITFYKNFQRLKSENTADLTTHEEWISVYVQYIEPLESSYSDLEINPRFRIISSINRGKLKKDYEDVMWKFNKKFQHFVAKEYPNWIKALDHPLLTVDFIEKIFKTFDPLKKYMQTYIIVIDCMRVDIWNQIKIKLLENFEVKMEKILFSLVPSSTIFSRTSIFSGKLPQECIIIPERGKPHLRNGDEKRSLARALNIPSDFIEFISQTESVVKVDEIDQVLSSPKKLKVIILDNIDNKIHRAGADDRLGKLKIEFINTYDTVIESILNKLIESKDIIIFVTSDHGFVNTNKIVMLESEYGFIGPRYMTPNPGVQLDEKWSITISAKDFGITTDKEKRYAFPIGNLSFKLARGNNIIRKRVRNEVKYGHGGLNLQEMLVPCAVLVPRRDTSLRPIEVKLKKYECMEETESTVIFEVSNPNFMPISQITILSNITSPLYFPVIKPKSSEVFTLHFTPKNEGKIELSLTINYKLRETHHEQKYTESVVIEKNQEIVRRYLDKEFDRLVG